MHHKEEKMSATFERDIVSVLVDRMNEPRHFIQILLGPRQTGKSTAVKQAFKRIDIPHHYAEVPEHGASPDWIRAQWQQARNLLSPTVPSAILVIDEVQYATGWSDAVKALWDEDSFNDLDLRVVLTGSSATLLRSGMDESLAGRFEIIRCTHWTLQECRKAFGFSLDDFLFFGGYPGAARLIKDTDRWQRYIRDAIIEPTIDKDILALETVRNPALLRRLFYVGAPYSAQEISYRKLLGQLDDKGNAATIAHYLELLDTAGMLSGLKKYDPDLLREKSSSPRLLVHNTALMTATYGRYRDYLLKDSDRYGHLVESAIGAYLIALCEQYDYTLNWWRDGKDEVDCVLSYGTDSIGIEVKSGRIKNTHGLTAFSLAYPHARTLIVGSAALSVEDFLLGKALPLF